MKKITFIAVMAILVSCTDYQVMDEPTSKVTPTSQNSKINVLIEQARRGNGDACLKLAECYREGQGVKKDFLNMAIMVSLAVDYGAIHKLESYFNVLPASDITRLTFETIERYDTRDKHETDSLAQLLVDRGISDGYTIQGVMKAVQGDTIMAKKFLNQAKDQGSSMAELLLCLTNLQSIEHLDPAKLAALTYRIPFANRMLGSIYSGLEGDMYERNDSLAAYYYLRADENACLGVSGARWLYNYHLGGGNLHLDETDIQRIKELAKFTPYDQEAEYREELSDTDEVDEIIEIIDEDVDEDNEFDLYYNCKNNKTR